METRYQRCDSCHTLVYALMDRIIKGKRVSYCFWCAEDHGWGEPEVPEPEQGRLF